MDTTDRDLIEEMLQYARLAIEFLGSNEPVALESDQKEYLAIRHALGIVGEAANHGYRHVEADIIVGTVRDHLPLLVEVLENGLKDAER